jgi:hypothetical protein
MQLIQTVEEEQRTYLVQTQIRLSTESHTGVSSFINIVNKCRSVALEFRSITCGSKSAPLALS